MKENPDTRVGVAPAGAEEVPVGLPGEDATVDPEEGAAVASPCKHWE